MRGGLGQLFKTDKQKSSKPNNKASILEMLKNTKRSRGIPPSLHEDNLQPSDEGKFNLEQVHILQLWILSDLEFPIEELA